MQQAKQTFTLVDVHNPVQEEARMVEVDQGVSGSVRGGLRVVPIVGLVDLGAGLVLVPASVPGSGQSGEKERIDARLQNIIQTTTDWLGLDRMRHTQGIKELDPRAILQHLLKGDEVVWGDWCFQPTPVMPVRNEQGQCEWVPGLMASSGRHGSLEGQRLDLESVFHVCRQIHDVLNRMHRWDGKPISYRNGQAGPGSAGRSGRGGQTG